MSYATRIALGSIFILINFIFFIVAAFQLFRSVPYFSDFSSHKISLITRSFNLITSILLVIFAFIDTDFWIWNENLSPPEAIYYINISVKVLIDIIICVTGSLIVLSLIKSYFVHTLNDTSFPSHIRFFWFGVATSFAFLCFVCILIAFAADQWIFVRVYGDIRLLYLFIAALYLAYTYYWVFYKENEDIKKHLRNSILLFIFSILSFIGSIYLMVDTFTHNNATWKIEEVVAAELNEEKAGVLFTNWCIFLLGWGAYWYIMAWYMKFVWLRSGNIMRTNSMNTVPAVSPGPSP